MKRQTRLFIILFVFLLAALAAAGCQTSPPATALPTEQVAAATATPLSTLTPTLGSGTGVVEKYLMREG
jgi:ABC-type transport system substrate-binding protein